MTAHIDKTEAGDQYSFQPPAAKPRTRKYRMRTIFETPITGRYPERLTWRDFEDGEDLRTIKPICRPGDADW